MAAASAALAPPPGLAATASDPVFEEVAARARSHCRFRNSSATEYASGSGTKWVGGRTTKAMRPRICTSCCYRCSLCIHPLVDFERSAGTFLDQMRTICWNFSGRCEPYAGTSTAAPPQEAPEAVPEGGGVADNPLYASFGGLARAEDVGERSEYYGRCFIS